MESLDFSAVPWQELDARERRGVADMIWPKAG